MLNFHHDSLLETIQKTYFCTTYLLFIISCKIYMHYRAFYKHEVIYFCILKNFINVKTH